MEHNQTIVNRQKLITALENQHNYKNFTWNFCDLFAIEGEETACGSVQKWKEMDIKDCGTSGCALGLAFQLGMITSPNCDRMEEFLGINKDQSKALFLRCKTYGVGFMDDVTPQMVADKIKEL